MSYQKRYSVELRNEGREVIESWTIWSRSNLPSEDEIHEVIMDETAEDTSGVDLGYGKKGKDIGLR